MSKKQDCTSMSSAKAEYMALSASCAQVMWMRTQLQDYGFNYNKIPLYCDSQSAIAISCNPVQHSCTKHIHTRYHFIMEQVENSIIELYFVRTEYQLVDMFTKALSEDRFQYLVRRIGMRCLTLAELEGLKNEKEISTVDCLTLKTTSWYPSDANALPLPSHSEFSQRKLVSFVTEINMTSIDFLTPIQSVDKRSYALSLVILPYHSKRYSLVILYGRMEILPVSYALSWKPCQGDSLNLPDHRIHKDGDGDASFQLKSDSLPHAHAQTTKTFYKHQDSRIMKAQELKTKTSAQTLIYKIFLQRYQVYQGRLLASFQDDAKYEHVGQDTRSQDEPLYQFSLFPVIEKWVESKGMIGFLTFGYFSCWEIRISKSNFRIELSLSLLCFDRCRMIRPEGCTIGNGFEIVEEKKERGAVLIPKIKRSSQQAFRKRRSSPVRVQKYLVCCLLNEAVQQVETKVDPFLSKVGSSGA
ncbi:hypothetical protein Tco_1157097 [Tanacetum coccineum]